MTTLARQQRAVLALLKNRPCDLTGDAWLTRISQSRELVMLREIARWWRQYQVSAQCRFTTLMLKRTGQFEESVNHYFQNGFTSPYIEEMARGFLRTLGSRGDALLREVALTELALLEVRYGRCTQVEWDRHPDVVFAALQNGASLPGPEDGFVYHLSIGQSLHCERSRRGAPSESAARVTLKA